MIDLKWLGINSKSITSQMVTMLVVGVTIEQSEVVNDHYLAIQCYHESEPI